MRNDAVMVSVIMPCYNDGKYIMESIDSVLNQTFDMLELIIVDDGSDEEETIRILNNISDDRIKLYRTKNLKPAGARNYGVQFATGKYILPVDSDDIIDKTYVEKAVDILETNLDIGVVYCEADLFGEKTGKWDLPKYSFETMLLDNIVFVTAMFYRKDWECVGGFNTYMDSGMEDYDFWLSILSLGKEIYQIPETLFHYRIKKESRTTRFLDNSVQVIEIYSRIYDNHKGFYGNHAEKYAKILRAALIEQTYLSRKYQYQIDNIKKYEKVPIVGKFIRKILSC